MGQQGHGVCVGEQAIMVQQYDVCSMVMRSSIVMMSTARCSIVRCNMMTTCNTMMGDGVTWENQLKQHVFN